MGASSSSTAALQNQDGDAISGNGSGKTSPWVILAIVAAVVVALWIVTPKKSGK